MKSNRKNKFIIIVGTNGSGKTISLIKFIKSYRRNVLVFNPTLEKKFFGCNEAFIKFEGLKKTRPAPATVRLHGEEFEGNIFPDFIKARRANTYIKRQAFPSRKFGTKFAAALKPLLESAYYSFRNGLLVLDDCSMMMQGRNSEDVESLFASRRQRDCDIITVFHSLGKIPPGIIPYATDIVMHKIIEKSESYSYKLPAGILEMKKRVVIRCKSNPYYFEHLEL